VTVFHAASLSGVLSELEERIEVRYEGLDVRLEPSGSQVAARKISELNRRADLVLTADWRVIDRLLLPDHAGWLIQFAANEIVLAHGEHSLHTAEITAENWPELLLRPGVRLGRANENTAPLGFQTLLVWKLSDRPEGDLLERLKERCKPEHVTPDIAELVALLQARVIHYAFVYRSIAEEHNLKVVRLPKKQNLGRPSMREAYAKARVPVRLRSGEPPVQIAGAPIVYGLTIPSAAPNRPDAQRVLAFLLGSEGRRILKRSGFRPLRPPQCRNPERLPPALKALVAATGQP
jgi:molybdate/tungstate transport system substrate-binding protein